MFEKKKEKKRKKCARALLNRFSFGRVSITSTCTRERKRKERRVDDWYAATVRYLSFVFFFFSASILATRATGSTRLHIYVLAVYCSAGVCRLPSSCYRDAPGKKKERNSSTFRNCCFSAVAEASPAKTTTSSTWSLTLKTLSSRDPRRWRRICAYPRPPRRRRR